MKRRAAFLATLAVTLPAGSDGIAQSRPRMPRIGVIGEQGPAEADALRFAARQH